MKKMLFVLALALVVVATPVWAAPTEDELLRMASAYAGLNVTQYEGDFGFTRLLVNGSTQLVNGSFTMMANGEIPRLVINGEQVVDWGDEPLSGLPENKVGSATDYHVQLNGWDGELGRYVTYGWFQVPLMKPGDPIAVQLSLYFQERLVSFDLDGRPAGSVVLRIIGDSRFSYDTNRGAFDVWVDPASAGDYEIVDVASGEVLATGSIQVGASGNNTVNAIMPNGIKELIPAGEDSMSWSNQNFQAVSTGKAWVPMLVYVARAYGSGLSIGPNLPFGGTINVYSVDGDESKLVLTKDVPMSVEVPFPGGVGKAGGSNVEVPAGFDHLVIQVVGNDNSWNTSFSLWACRNGGGKG